MLAPRSSSGTHSKARLPLPVTPQDRCASRKLCCGRFDDVDGRLTVNQPALKIAETIVVKRFAAFTRTPTDGTRRVSSVTRPLRTRPKKS